MANNFLSLLKNDLFKNLFIFSLVFLTIIIFAPEELYMRFLSDNFVALHLVMELCIVFFSLAIAVQLGLVSRYDLSKRTVMIGASFFTMGMLEIAHLLTFTDMPYLFQEPNPTTSTWFSILSKLALVLGLIISFSVNDKKVKNLYRHWNYGLATSVISIVAFLVMNPKTVIALFDIQGNDFVIKGMFHCLLLCLYIIAIAVILKSGNLQNIRTLVYITSFLYFCVGEVILIGDNELSGKYIFVDHFLNLLAFGFLFFSIYYLRVREPFEEISKANQFLLDSEAKIKQLAYFDEITNLPNEKNLKEFLDENLATNNHKKALVVLELTKYESIRSSLGAKIANQFNRSVTERLSSYIHQRAMIYKVGENQYGLIINDVESKNGIENFILELEVIFQEPIVINDFSIPTDIRVGVSIYLEDAKNGAQLIEHAFFSIFEAKKSSKLFEFYQLNLHKEQEDYLLLENDLRYALDEQLYLEYQPQLDLIANKIVSTEALVRWKHPIKGNIPPQQFIPMAERNGLIIPIGKWVLEQACKQTVELRRITEIDYSVAVNLSIYQFYQKDFYSMVREILDDTGLPASKLQLEITESMTIDKEEIIPTLLKLKKLGITIAVDDFGTGYSSLSYLKDFPLDVLKIDRSFIINLLNNEKDEQLVKMMITLAKHLNLKVVAEGIETKGQLDFLNEIGCDKIQGYYISKPITMDLLISKFHR